jgi:hypothetical protein
MRQTSATVPAWKKTKGENDMGDGAHLGVNAERAIETILGGEPQPVAEEKQTPEQMLDAIRAASGTPSDYGGAATSYARVILEAYEKYPELRNVPLESVYLRGGDGMMVWTEGGSAVVLRPDIYSVLKQLHPDKDCWQRRVMSGLSGFMVGWANNAVRYALGDPPVANPALVEIG